MRRARSSRPVASLNSPKLARTRKIARLILAVAPVATFLTSRSALATGTLTWDPTHVPATPAGGSGNWDTVTSDWSNATADFVWPNDNATIALLNAGSGTLTIDQSLLGIEGLTFAATAGAYNVTTASS